jgi:hypothetical protein
MKRTITITIIALGALWVIVTGVLLFYVAQIVGVPWLLGAFVGMDAAFFVALALLITTNTRPRWPDPYAQTTAELLRPPLLRDDDRRTTPGTIDNRGIVARMSDMLEEEASKRPAPENAPPWAIDMNRVHHQRADDAFTEGDE